MTLKVSGIVRPNSDAVASMMSGAIGYTSALTEYAISRAAESDIVKEQLANPTVDVITGLPFKGDSEEEFTDAEKAEMIKSYFAGLTNVEKRRFILPSNPKCRRPSLRHRQMLMSPSIRGRSLSKWWFLPMRRRWA